MSVTLETRRTNDELKAIVEAGAAELAELGKSNATGEATATQVAEWVGRNFAGRQQTRKYTTQKQQNQYDNCIFAHG